MKLTGMNHLSEEEAAWSVQHSATYFYYFSQILSFKILQYFVNLNKSSIINRAYLP